MKKNYKYFSDGCKDIHNDDKTKHTVEKRDAECQTEENDLGFNIFQGPSQSSSNSADVKKPEKYSDLGLGWQLCTERLLRWLEKCKFLFSFVVSLKQKVKTERIYPSGEREIIHKNGTHKFISADGKFKKVLFYNGDIKEMYSDGRIIYTYHNGIVETRLPDDTKITKYPNGQIQCSKPNGEKEIKFPDGTIHNILPNGTEEIRTADGKIVKNLADGTKVIELANGQKEIITSTYKKREFPNGSIRIYYNDGKQKTRYNNGRIKIKDKEGKIIFDTKYLNSQGIGWKYLNIESTEDAVGCKISLYT